MPAPKNKFEEGIYKLYEKSLLYEGSDKSSERHISKEKCKEWSDGYNIQEEYGYRYLHSGNVLLFKVYNNFFCFIYYRYIYFFPHKRKSIIHGIFWILIEK